MSSLSVIVAFREDVPGRRTQIWKYLQKMYARLMPETEVCVASDDGENPFHKTLAYNRAVAASHGDVLLIQDADMWVPTEQVAQGLVALERGSAWSRPWNLKVKLGREDTNALLKNPNWTGEFEEQWNDHHRRENLNTYWAAPPFLIHRWAFERVKGYDERFRGWGQEDEAFALSVRTLTGKPHRVNGYSAHLWHPRIGKSGHDLWPGQDSVLENLRLVRQYQESVRDPKRMERLVEDRYTRD